MKNGLAHKLWLALAPVLGVVAFESAAEATTINVTTSGASKSGKCSLTDAIKAAVTNTAVGGKGGCPAGSSSTDTVVLQANTTYDNYGTTLHIPFTGGTLIIRGTLSGGSITTKINGTNYGYPSPNPINPGVCPYPAAIFSGGTNVTIRDLGLPAKTMGTGHTGICQYSGALTLNNVVVGDGGQVNVFIRGGIRSFPNTDQTRTLTLTSTYVHGNETPDEGGGLHLIGNVSVSITNSDFHANIAERSGGGIYWEGTGSVNVTDTDFQYNESLFGSGGAMYFNPWSDTASSTLTRVDAQVNTAGYYGGGIWLGPFGTDKLRLVDVFFLNNSASNWLVPFDPTQETFNTDFAYNAIRCTSTSHFSGLHLPPWTNNNPRLKGDNTCTYETW